MIREQAVQGVVQALKGCVQVWLREGIAVALQERRQRLDLVTVRFRHAGRHTVRRVCTAKRPF